MFPGLDLYHTDPAQRVKTADTGSILYCRYDPCDLYDLHDLGRDVSDVQVERIVSCYKLSLRGEVIISYYRSFKPSGVAVNSSKRGKQLL